MTPESCITVDNNYFSAEVPCDYTNVISWDTNNGTSYYILLHNNWLDTPFNLVVFDNSCPSDYIFDTTLSSCQAACETTGTPQLLNGTAFLNNTLSFTVQSPTGSGRTLTGIQLGGSSDPACSFDAVFTQDCYNYIVANFSWADHSSCNFVEDDSNPDYISFKAFVYVYSNVVSEFGGSTVTRTTTDILNIATRFPKGFTISSTITQAPTPLSALTAQSYSPMTGLGVIEFITQLPWPYALQAGSVATVPSGLSLYTALNETTDGTCNPILNTNCTQLFTYEIVPDDGTCTLTGSYVVDFDVVCRGRGECALDSNSNTTTVTLSVDGSNFCGTTESYVSVASQFALFEDPEHTIPKSQFYPNQTGYFVVQLDSQADVGGLSLDTLTVTSMASPPAVTPLLVGGAPTAEGVLLGNVAVGGNVLYFSIEFASDVFYTYGGQSAGYEIDAYITISYQENMRKRSLASDTLVASVQFEIL